MCKKEFNAKNIFDKGLVSIRAGLPRVREKSGKLKFFQGQGIVREFSKLSVNF